jgi:hypothetical protein
LLFRPAQSAQQAASTDTQTFNTSSPQLIRTEAQTLTTALDGTAAVSIRPEYLLSNLDLQITASLFNGQSQSVQITIRNTP